MGTDIKSNRGIFLLEIVESFFDGNTDSREMQGREKSYRNVKLGPEGSVRQEKGRQWLGTHKACLFLQEMRWRRGVRVSYLRAGRSSLSYLHRFSQKNRKQGGL